jgi:hypothetical protein
VTDFLDEKRKEITDRLKEIKPLVDEYQRLEAAASALAGVGGSASSASSVATAPRRRGPGRPRGSVNRTSAKATETAAPTATATAPAKAGRKKPGRPPGRKKPGRPAGSTSSSSSTPRRAGRRKGSGTRAAEALAFVTGQPGITIPELAAKMGIKQNYLYRVLPSLEQEGKVAKKGRGWHPKG